MLALVRTFGHVVHTNHTRSRPCGPRAIWNVDGAPLRLTRKADHMAMWCGARDASFGQAPAGESGAGEGAQPQASPSPRSPSPLRTGPARVASGQGEVEVGDAREGRECSEVGREQPTKVDHRARDSDGAQLVRGAPQPAMHGLGAG